MNRPEQRPDSVNGVGSGQRFFGINKIPRLGHSLPSAFKFRQGKRKSLLYRSTVQRACKQPPKVFDEDVGFAK
jgi:hypothetical protein